MGSFDGARLALREIHRFANGPVTHPTGLHWDIERLFDEVRRALRAAGPGLAGVGIDAWGVDYGLLDGRGSLLAPPHHYRDRRTHGLMNEAIARLSRDRIYTRTGIQFLPFNTLYQLMADKRTGLLDRAASLLFIPDLLHFWLTAVQGSERSIASTSQLYDVAADRWATDLAEPLGIPTRLLPEVAPPGTTLGPLLPSLATELGIPRVPVITPASHDTGSAIAAVPAAGSDWAYISSGTWSLVGRELPRPLITPAALAANFTNESGVEGTIRFHKNVAGLFLLQECQRAWEAEGRSRSADELTREALSAPPLAVHFDPDHPTLADLGDMPSRIRYLCRQHARAPDSDAALIRSILESLALKYRYVIDSLEALTGPVRVIHIVGGGVNNAPLCQFTADACNRPVLAGPVEATAAGNAMVQALAQGRVRSLAEIRAVIRASMAPALYEPRATAAWSDAYMEFRTLLTR